MRLSLLPINKIFALDIFENFTKDVTIYMYPCPSKEISETEKIIEYWEKQCNIKTDYIYAITLNETSEFIGIAGIHNLNKDTPELGIWTKVNSHGNYYGREAIGALIKFAKNIGYSRLVYPVDKRNIASKKIPIYYGGKLIESNKIVKTPDGRILDEEIYEIIL